MRKPEPIRLPLSSDEAERCATSFTCTFWPMGHTLSCTGGWTTSFNGGGAETISSSSPDLLTAICPRPWCRPRDGKQCLAYR